MFESLTDRFSGIFDKLRSKGRLSEADVDAALREVRLALLEADVNAGVARTLLERIRAEAVGTETAKSLTPGHQIIKLVNDSLIETLGSEAVPLSTPTSRPLKILMADS